ncbi:SH3 domain-containing protein [Streptomyces sp. NPDC101455]|uniref:SH3 domain-containing protein n=1 Tax=Streptomyces sp. NPDC101455 TaxID=3366142 RepID=UPI00381A88DE
MITTRRKAPRAIRMAAVGTVAAALMVPALTASAEAATAKVTVVGPSACGTIYPSGYWWTYPTTNLNLRSGPGTGYTSLGLILKGSGVEVQCKAKTAAGWMRVSVLNGHLKGRAGWVASKYLAS